MSSVSRPSRETYRESVRDDLPRTRQAALRKVASHIAGLIQAGDIEEASGLNPRYLTEAEADRLTWAMDEVTRRLYAMGGRQ